MATSGHDDLRRYVRIYVAVFGALLGLTVMTVAIASAHLVLPLAIAIALLVAAVKGGLVAGFFMHLLRERGVIFATLVPTLILLLALLLLPVLGAMSQMGRQVAPTSTAGLLQER